MKKPRFARSISFRLSLLIMTIVMLGVGAVSTLFILQDFNRTVSSERLRLEDTSRAFAAASSAPLADDDTGELYRVLRGIADVENAQYISVVSKSGENIAEIGSSIQLAGRDGALDDKSIWSSIMADTLTTRTPIWANGIEIGTLEMHSDIAWLRAEYRDTLAIMVLSALLLASLVAGLTNYIVQHSLRPLKQMSNALVAMEKNPDLSARFIVENDDEVGVLSTALNTAFSTIQERDNAIRKYNDELEDTVQLRTQELAVAAKLAEDANAAKSDFLATMSHEIRTPMNGMLVMAELLAKSELSPKQQKFAQIISRSGSSLLNIINDVLDMSKIEAGKLDLEHVPFSISDLVEDAIKLYAASAREKKLTLATVISPRVAKTYIGDPTRIGQIIANLTSNAIKFTEQGGVTIRVDTQPQNNGAQKLRLSVIDTGVGIPADKLNTIFEAFSQADQSITRNFGGTGLGLTICRRLSEAMGGKIYATSTLGEGAAFSVELALPINEESVLVAPNHQFSVSQFDECPISRDALAETLKARGISVLTNSETGGDLALVTSEMVEQAAKIIGSTPCILITENLFDDDCPPPVTGDLNIVGQTVAPLPLSDIQKIIDCLNVGNFDAFSEVVAVGEELSKLGDFSHLKVLAVDDNAINREVINEALKAMKVEAQFAESGEQAVAIAGKTRFDVIFMDCSMPGMDGYEATGLIRKSAVNASTYIVALTAHVAGEAAGRWQAAGMDSYLAKPFTIDQLAAQLATVSKSDHAVSSSAPSMNKHENAPSLLSKETMDMFAMVSEQTGDDMRNTVFTMFIEQVDTAFGALVDAVRQNSAHSSVKELAHALKSMCSSAGAEAVQGACQTIEAAAANGQLPSEDQLVAVNDLIARTKAEMQSQISVEPEKSAQKRHMS